MGGEGGIPLSFSFISCLFNCYFVSIIIAFDNIIWAKFVSYFCCIGGQAVCNLQFYHPSHAQGYSSLKTNRSGSRRKQFVQLNGHSRPVANKRFCIYVSNQLGRATSAELQNPEILLQKTDGGPYLPSSQDTDNSGTLQSKSKMFKNRFLNFVRFGSVINGAAESFFKSEIRRRLFVTAVLIVFSRVGYFIPLPGFDRRLIPEDYLSFVSGSVGKYH